MGAGMLEEPRNILPQLNKTLEMLVYQGAGFDYAKGEYIDGPPAEPSLDTASISESQEQETPAGGEKTTADDSESTADSTTASKKTSAEADEDVATNPFGSSTTASSSEIPQSGKIKEMKM